MAEGRGRSPRDGGPRGRDDRRPGSRSGSRASRVPARSSDPQAARHRLTGRAAVLVLVVVALMVSYASSLRAYLDQRAHIAALEERIQRSERNIEALEEEKERWKDPAYVISQARARFAFGFPGEVGYQVLDEEGEPLDPQATLADPEPVDDHPEWWQTTLASIDAAAFPPDEDDGPAKRIRPPQEKPAR